MSSLSLQDKGCQDQEHIREPVTCEWVQKVFKDVIKTVKGSAQDTVVLSLTQTAECPGFGVCQISYSQKTTICRCLMLVRSWNDIAKYFTQKCLGERENQYSLSFLYVWYKIVLEQG